MFFRIYLLLPTRFRKNFLIRDPLAPDFSGTVYRKFFTGIFLKNFSGHTRQMRETQLTQNATPATSPGKTVSHS
jgi:hypothetical protein